MFVLIKCRDVKLHFNDAAYVFASKNLCKPKKHYKMKHVTKCIVAFLLMICPIVELWAQTLPPMDGVPAYNKKFGKPTMEEMTMASYPLEPEADAVVISQTCDVNYTMVSMYNLHLTYDYRIRIKVLKDEGKKYGDFSIPFYSENKLQDKDEEQFFALEAASYNLNEKGKIVATKLTPQLINEERVNEHYKVKKFSVPNVQKGSIIEVHYELFSPRYYNIYDYEMQWNIPIIYQKYFMEIPAVLLFNVEAPTKRSNVKAKVYTGYIEFTNNSGIEKPRCNSNCYELESYYMPALRKMPFIWNEDDYKAKVTCDLKTMQFPGAVKQEVGSTWDQADQLILEQDQIGPRLNDKSKFKEELDASGLAAIPDEFMRISSAVRFLSSRVAWDGKYGNIPESASTVIKKKSGNTADINMMLINVLNDLGITSYPVYLSTRKHGRLPIHPSANAFNTFVVAVDVNNQTYFVDGTDPYGAINVLDPNLYVAKGRKIGKKIEGSWVDLTKLAQHNTTYTSNINVAADGTMTGDVSTRYLKNSARQMKHDYHNAKDSLGYVQSLQKKYDITVDELSLVGHDQYGEDVKSDMKFHKSGEATDDHIYVNPFVFNPMGESPFKEETRELPIELPYQESVNYYVDIFIPEGYEVEETPKGYEVTLPDRSMTAKMTCKKNEEMVRLTFAYTCKNLLYSEDEYTAVKQVYDMACQKMGDMIVLKKK